MHPVSWVLLTWVLPLSLAALCPLLWGVWLQVPWKCSHEGCVALCQDNRTPHPGNGDKPLKHPVFQAVNGGHHVCFCYWTVPKPLLLTSTELMPWQWGKDLVDKVPRWLGDKWLAVTSLYTIKVQVHFHLSVSSDIFLLGVFVCVCVLCEVSSLGKGTPLQGSSWRSRERDLPQMLIW